MQQVILVDWHNLFKMCERKNIRSETIIGEIMQMGLANGEIQEIRLFIPCYLSPTPWRSINSLQRKWDIEVSTCPVLSEHTDNGIEMKDTVDFKVLQWVQTHLHQGVAPDSVVFVTGDGHFLISGNAAKRKGKKVVFWSVNPQNVHRLILQQEEFREISISPPTLLLKENSYLETLRKIINHDVLSPEDQIRAEALAKMAERSLEAEKESTCISMQSEDTELVEALMALGIARIYPAIHEVIDIDTASPLFRWLLPQGRSL